MFHNLVSLGNKRKLSQIFFSLKAIAVHPLLCYPLSFLNDKRIIFHWKQIIWHQSFSTECWCLVTRPIFEHVLDPRWRLTYIHIHFHTAILHLFQTTIFLRKRPNLLMEWWELFYHSLLDTQGLNFTRFGS